MQTYHKLGRQIDLQFTKFNGVGETSAPHIRPQLCCMFIKIICGVNQYNFDFFPCFLYKKQGGEQLTLLMYAGYFECLGFEPFTS